MDEPPVRKILAMAPNWLGDVAMCTPALRALHLRFPEADLAVAGRPSACELLEGLPWLAALVPFEARLGFVDTIKVSYRLRLHAGDLAVVFPHSFRAALLAGLSGAKRRIGYDRDRRGLLLTERVPPHRADGQIEPVYMAHEYLQLVAPLGCTDDGLGLELRADAAETERVRPCFTGMGPKVGLAPGAAFGPSKRWPAERYGQVADALAARLGAQCALLTGPGEEAVRDVVLANAETTLIRCHDGRPGIKNLKAVIAQLDLLIGNDSGPRHVAVAFGVPTVCLMGATSPKYSESPDERGTVLRVDVDCGPCQKPVCETDHRCMTRISVEDVVTAATAALEEGRGRGASTASARKRPGPAEGIDR